MPDRIRDFFFKKDVLQTAAVWLVFGVLYAALTPPFMKTLPSGVFLGACFALFIGIVRQSSRFITYCLDKRKALKANDRKALARVTEQYRSMGNPWLPAGILLLIPAGLLYLLLH